MNTTHLGDALDHWKGSLLAALKDQLPASATIRVLPLITDPEKWTQEHTEAYARLLRIHQSQVDQTRWMGMDRKAYFRKADSGSGDLFVDPDTGMEPLIGAKREHLRVEELLCLLKQHETRIVAVYQHRRRLGAGETVSEVIQLIRKERSGQNVFLCAYEGTAVAMLFFSLKNHRLDGLCTKLRKELGPKGDERVKFHQI